MTNQPSDTEILELVKEHFTEEWCEEDGYGWTEFAGKFDAFVKFSRQIFEMGRESASLDGVY